jgi:hypothetical protein
MPNAGIGGHTAKIRVLLEQTIWFALEHKTPPPSRDQLAQLAPPSAGFSLEVTARFFSTFPHTAQMAGIVVTSPMTVRVAPIVLRSSLVNRSANKRAIPAPRIARVATIIPSSGRSRRTCFMRQPRLGLRAGQTDRYLTPPLQYSTTPVLRVALIQGRGRRAKRTQFNCNTPQAN